MLFLRYIFTEQIKGNRWSLGEGINPYLIFLRKREMTSRENTEYYSPFKYIFCYNPFEGSTLLRNRRQLSREENKYTEKYCDNYLYYITEFNYKGTVLLHIILNWTLYGSNKRLKIVTDLRVVSGTP